MNQYITMTHSMTAFASHKTHDENGVVQWDIRSVNHRHLDLRCFLPPNFSALETRFQELLRKHLRRGRIDCQLTFTPAKSTMQFSLNEALLEQLLKAYRHIEAGLEQDSKPRPMELLKWPGLLQITESDVESLFPALAATLDTAAKDLVAARKREGSKLANSIRERLQSIQTILETIKTRLPQVLESQQKRLLKKLDEAKVTLDPHRLEQEIVIMAHKMDVAEELDRLGIHIKEVERLLEAPGNHGRRLDFLMQEMNREANTLGAKTNESDIIHASVEMKVTIEQMREQIQNIE